MTLSIEVTEEFLEHRAAKAALYNQRGRTDRQFLMDLDAEIYEWHMIRSGKWRDFDDWKVDALMPRDDDWLAIDVKFISKYYNLTPTKVCNLLQQRGILDGYLFMEWVSKPRRPLKAGDTVTVRQLGFIHWDDLADAVKPSTNYKDWGTSHYVDVHRLLRDGL